MFGGGVPTSTMMALTAALVFAGARSACAQHNGGHAGGHGGGGFSSGHGSAGHFSAARPSAAVGRSITGQGSFNSGKFARPSGNRGSVGFGNFRHSGRNPGHVARGGSSRGNQRHLGYRRGAFGYATGIGVYSGVAGVPYAWGYPNPWGYPSYSTLPDYSSFYYPTSPVNGFGDPGYFPSPNIVPPSLDVGGVAPFTFDSASDGAPQVDLDPAPAFADSPPGSGISGRSALINVQVPANAELFVEGQKTSRTGISRWFESPPLAPGVDYSYRMTARWLQGGRVVENTRSITVRAGDRFSISFAEQVPAR